MGKQNKEQPKKNIILALREGKQVAKEASLC